MRIYTDGACSHNGKSNAKAGYAVWFPDHRTLSMSERLPESEPQTNNRAELTSILKAVCIAEDNGFIDEDLIIYSDSNYSIDCLTKYLPSWVANGWKTKDGNAVKNQDLIKDISHRLSRFKSHRFVHVRAHTGNKDDLSVNNDIVDRMAQKTIDDTIRVHISQPTDELFPGCSLRLLGPPVAQSEIVNWVKSNLDTLDQTIVQKHLFKAFTEICKERGVNLTKQTIAKTAMIRAEKEHLQIETLIIHKNE
jgi:ribonuclease HI